MRVMIFLFALMLVGCNSSVPTNNNATQSKPAEMIASSAIKKPSSLEDERYAVYDAVLNTYIIDKTEMLVINNSSPVCENKEYTLSKKEVRQRNETINDDIKIVREKMPYVLEETINDYRSKKPICLKPLFNLKVKYKLLEANEIKAISISQYKTARDRLNAFNEKYPHANGTLHLSDVGFNSQMSQALVYVGMYRSGDDGRGSYFTLVKENGVWKIQGSAITWVA